MGKLSHIDEVEARKDEAPQVAPEPQPQAAEPVAVTPEAAPEPEAMPEPEPAAAPAVKSSAEVEADFHGLNDLEKNSGGHIALIVAAVVVLIVIIVYIVMKH